MVSASSRERGEIRVGDERWIGTDVAVMRAQSILCSSILRVVETKIFRGVRDRGSFRHFYASCVFSLVLCTLLGRRSSSSGGGGVFSLFLFFSLRTHN